MAIQHIVLVGGGVAGVTAAETLRSSGYTGTITLVEADVRPPYDRPPLSKSSLVTGVPAPLRTDDTWTRLEVDLRLGVTAEAVDVDGHVLSTSAGPLPYDRLLLATGSCARWPASLTPIPGATTLRTADDAAALRERLVPNARLVIVGAGLIGCEVAASAARLGVQVTLVDPLPKPLAAVVGSEVARRLLDRHVEEGVKVLTGVTATALHGGTDVESVELSDGSVLPADAVLVAVGGAAASAWLQGGPLELAAPTPNGGVRCDRALRAGPDVFVAGDLAVPDGHGRSEHWMAAVEQAEVAARNLLQPDHACEEWVPAPYFWTDQYDTKVQAVGTPPAGEEHVLEETSGDGRRQLRVWADEDGRAVAAVTVNWPAKAMGWRERVRTGVLAAPVESSA